MQSCPEVRYTSDVSRKNFLMSASFARSSEMIFVNRSQQRHVLSGFGIFDQQIRGIFRSAEQLAVLESWSVLTHHW